MNYLDQSRGGGEFVSLGLHLMLAKGGSPLDAAEIAENRRAPTRVVSILRSAISAGTLADPSWAGSLSEYRIPLAGFVESLRSQSAFDRLLADGARRVPLRTRVVSTTLGLTGASVGEGVAKVASRLTLASANIRERKVATYIVTSEELARAATALAEAFLARELRLGLGAATDAEFLPGLIDSATPTVPGTDDVAADLAAGTASMTLHAGSRLYVIVTADDAANIALTTTTDGVFAYPDMTPQGGTIAGITVLVSDGLPAASSGATNALLIDASGLVLADETITLDSSRNASIEMSDTPAHDSTTPTGASLTSMWQTNSVALKAERYFGFERIRDDAVVLISDAAW